MKQFSIRDVLFVVVIVALVLGWWLDRRPVPGRFQMQVTANHAFIFDKDTGQVWSARVLPDGVLSGSQEFRDAKLSP